MGYGVQIPCPPLLSISCSSPKSYNPAELDPAILITIVLTAVTVVLAALGLFLAGLGLGIGALALWGYKGMKEAIAETVQREVPAVASAVVAEYREVLDKLKKEMELTNKLQAQLKPPLESISIEMSSKSGVQGIQKTSVESDGIRKYPGEEVSNAGNESSTGVITEPNDDAGNDHRQAPD